MRAKCFFIFATTLSLLGCSNGADDDAARGSGGSAGARATSGAGNVGDNAGSGVGAAPSGGTAGSASTDDDALFVPQDIVVMPLSGGNGVLDMVALTLRQDANGTEAYAALKNDGDTPACDAGLTLQLFDENQQSLTSSIGGLLTQRLYRFTDGSGTVAACIAPGDVTMAALTDLPADLALDDVGFVVYSCSYFALDVTPIDGFSVSQLESQTASDGTSSFTGTFTNGFDAAVANPSVTVFPVNRVGRPLAAAIATGTDSVAPGATWSFETNAVDAVGTDAVAYPTAATSD